MRICLVYDCLYPHTVGGAERWYRSLAERLAADGHEVTYLTLRQWERGNAGLAGVNVCAVGPEMELYSSTGRRRIFPPLVFGIGVLVHLARHGRSYDAVHTASFPYFSLLAISAVRPFACYSVAVDWHEVWSLEYWREYLGPLGGWIGWLVQRICVRRRQSAFCFSRLHGARLMSEGLRGRPVVLTGEYVPSVTVEPVTRAEVRVVFAGRHIAEKRVPSVVRSVAEARKRIPELSAIIIGDGPERDKVIQEIERLGLSGIVDAPGFVPTAVVQAALASALCLVLPSRREGYGLVVVEASACGTPSVVVAGSDNAAVELIAEGENGFVAASSSPEDLGAAIVRVFQAGLAMRSTTAAWFSRNSERLSMDSSLQKVISAYGPASGNDD